MGKSLELFASGGVAGRLQVLGQVSGAKSVDSYALSMHTNIIGL